ncbi:DMT family transporter [Georgenia sp. SYP-B2076]|uniref:DMT family transporter n=1 Tax=Georgenia sp. SYP-B2076 TaxID=2495881 RepID=UPI00197A7CBE|nr:DMT family transporter [Georgenia sp. SYP-B2076]
MALSVDAPVRAHEVVPPEPAPVRRVPSGAPRPNRRLGVLAIVVSATAMGTAGVFGRMAAPPGALIGEALTMGRMLVGALGMLAILTVARRLGVLRRTRLSWSVVLGGVFLGLSLATLLSATVLIDLSRAVALHYLGPVLATVLARVLLKESITRVELLSLAGSFLGMMLAAGLIGGQPAPSSDQPVLGTVLGVVSGVFYGAALLCYRYRTDMPADIRSFWNFAFGTLGTAGMVALTRPDISGMTATHWAWAVAFFLVCGLLALGLLVVAGKHLRAAELSSLSYWEVVVALLLGAAVFGESISLAAAMGAGLIVAAAVLPLVAGRRA